MKTLMFFVVLVMMAFVLQAQDYQISFTGSGSAVSVDSIFVENITQGTDVRMAGNDILRLKATIGIEEPDAGGASVAVIPNPMPGEGVVAFSAVLPGSFRMTLSDLQGRIILSREEQLAPGMHQYRIAGLPQGVFLMSIRGAGCTSDTRIVSTAGGSGYPRLTAIAGDGQQVPRLKIIPESGQEVIMQYTAGDRLKITGKSGSNRTITMLVPTVSQTVIIPFHPCVDGSGNNYPIVKIGNQTWMAANLRTTAFLSTGSIPQISDPSAWAGYTAPACCLYQNDQAYTVTYGLLYNGYAALSGNICPQGWHVASDPDWTTLEIFLQNHGYNYDGFVDTDNDRFTNNKTAKSMAANSLWGFSLNEGAVGNDLSKNNQCGFSAYPGGYRFETGNFDYLGMYAIWWTSSYYTGGTLYRALYFTDCDVKRNMLNNRYGYSIRCVRDE